MAFEYRDCNKVSYQTSGLATEQTALTIFTPLTKSDVACNGAEVFKLIFLCSNWYAAPIITANTTGANKSINGFEFVNSFFIIVAI